MIPDSELSPLPNGWTWTNLDSITQNLDGKRVPVNDKERQKMKGTFPYYGASGIIDYVNDYLFDGVFLLIGEDGANLLSRSTPIAFLAKGKFWVNNHAHILATYGQIPLQYVAFYINSISLALWVTGTAQPKLNQARMKTIQVPLAPLEEQKRIVGKVEELFSFLDEGVGSLYAVQAQLKHYRQAVLKYAFEGKLTKDWRRKYKDQVTPNRNLLEDDTLKDELPSLNKPIIQKLPDGWFWIRLARIAASMKNGIYRPPSFYVDDGFACLRMYNIEKGTILWKNIKRMKLTSEEIEEYGLRPGDILVNRVNSRELVGKSAVISEGLEPCVYESKNIRLRLVNEMSDSKYVAFWILYYGQKYFNRNAQQTVGMASINQEQLGSMPIPFCSLLEQKLIVREIERQFSVADASDNTIFFCLKLAERLRQSVLKKAFEGRLVPQDPSDELAEKLLLRIENERNANKLKAKDQLELSRYVK